jgi:hypothetical protein
MPKYWSVEMRSAVETPSSILRSRNDKESIISIIGGRERERESRS